MRCQIVIFRRRDWPLRRPRYLLRLEPQLDQHARSCATERYQRGLGPLYNAESADHSPREPSQLDYIHDGEQLVRYGWLRWSSEILRSQELADVDHYLPAGMPYSASTLKQSEPVLASLSAGRVLGRRDPGHSQCVAPDDSPPPRSSDQLRSLVPQPKPHQHDLGRRDDKNIRP